MSFKVGEPVKVLLGSYRDETGMILGPAGEWWYVQLSDKLIQVPAHHLQSLQK
jgi:hypothetical protein